MINVNRFSLVVYKIRKSNSLELRRSEEHSESTGYYDEIQGTSSGNETIHLAEDVYETITTGADFTESVQNDVYETIKSDIETTPNEVYGISITNIPNKCKCY